MMIEAKSLYKRYGEDIALSDISFEVEEGKIVGVLGRAGCGKTTVANMLTGYISSDGGSVSICGYDIEKHPRKAKSFFGYLPENSPIYTDMTVSEYLHFLARLKRFPISKRKSEIGRVIESLRLEEVAGKLIGKLSRGQIRKAALAGTILGDPPILFLDQPTAGLSPDDTRVIREILKDLRENRTMVIFSNSLSEVEELCASVMILNNGRIAAYEPISELRYRAGERSRLKLKLQGDTEQVRLMAVGLAGLLDVEYQKGSGGTVDVMMESFATDDLRPQIWAFCKQADMQILEMRYLDVSLEDIFMQLTGKSGGVDL